MNTQFCVDYGAFISALPFIMMLVVMFVGYAIVHVSEVKKVNRK